MRDNEKNKSQLIKELSALRKQVMEFEDLQVERNQVEEKLRESEEKYRLLFAAEQDAIVIVDIESQRIVDANDAALAQYGYTKKEFIGSKALDLSAEPEKSTAMISKTAKIRKGTVQSNLRNHKKKDGTVFPVEVSAGTFILRNKKMIHAAFRDNTERKRAEESLRETERKNRALIEAIPDMMFIMSKDGTFLEFIPAEDSEPLIPPSEFLGKKVSEVMPELAEKTMRFLKKTLDTETTQFFEYQFLMDEQLCEYEACLVVSGKDQVLVMVRDITARKRAETALRESESKFRILAQMTSAAIFIYQKNRVKYVNPAATKITGYNKGELLKMNFWEIIHPDFKKLVKKRGLARQTGERVPSRYEVKIQMKGGEERWVDFTARVTTFEQNPAVLGTAVDITERKRTEEALLESEERYRTLSESAFEGIIISVSGKLVMANQAFADMFGYDSHEIIGLSPVEMTTPESAEIIMKNIQSSHERPYEIIGVRKDGSTFNLEIMGKDCLFKSRKARVAALRDITERKQGEDALRESEAKFRVLAETTSAAIFIFQRNRMRYVNPAAANITGYIQEELLKMNFLGDYPSGFSKFD